MVSPSKNSVSHFERESGITPTIWTAALLCGIDHKHDLIFEHVDRALALSAAGS
jgi:hypothetical protein